MTGNHLDWANAIVAEINTITGYSAWVSSTGLVSTEIDVCTANNFLLFVGPCFGLCTEPMVAQMQEVGFGLGGTVCLGVGGTATIQRRILPTAPVPALTGRMYALLVGSSVFAGAWILRRRRARTSTATPH